MMVRMVSAVRALGVVLACLVALAATSPAGAQQRQTQPVPQDTCSRTGYNRCQLDLNQCNARCSVATLPPPCRLQQTASGGTVLNCPTVQDDSSCRASCAATVQACVARAGC
jgi:hypothetical protein